MRRKSKKYNKNISNNKKQFNNDKHQMNNEICNLDTKDIHINRNYKDNLFRFLFKDKNNLLSLYNALNNTNYTDADLLEVTTIECFIYMEMKNDVSFMLDCTLNLFEHQSSINPNMPLRGLFYFSKHYDKIVVSKSDLHNSTLYKIPTPRYVVFYNGKDKLPEKKVLKLSDAFFNQSVKGCIEVEATILNINYGNNKDIMEKCRILSEYAEFVKIVRNYIESNIYAMKEDAIDSAVQYCIEHNILPKILREHRAEVIKMFLYEYTFDDFKKDQENALAKLAKTEELIKEKEMIISKQDELINEKDELINEKDELINEKDELINEKDELINEKDELINEKDELLNEKDEIILQMKKEIELLKNK